MSRTAHGSRETPDKGVVLDPAVAPSKASPTARQALPLGPKHESLVVASPNGRPFAATDAVKTGGMEPGQMESGQIEPGRALAIADFSPPHVSTSERLIRLAYGLGLPASALNPFRKRTRPRLTATVTTALTGDPVAGTALRAGHFLLHGVKLPIADTEFSGPRLSPPFERLVHGFGWLGDLASCAPRQQGAPVAERIFAAWLAANPQPGSGPAWAVSNTGQRLLAWLVHAPLLLSIQDRKLRSKVLMAFEDTARWLDRHVGRAEDKLSEVAGWTALTAAGLLLAEGRARRLYGESGLIRALGDLVSDDGGVLSRSPLCQIEAIELLIELRGCYAAVRSTPPPQLESILELLVPPLLTLLHSDGGLDRGRALALSRLNGLRT